MDIDIKLKEVGYQQLTSLSSAKALTVPNKASVALLLATGQTVRFSETNGQPTASTGMLLPVNLHHWFLGDLYKVRFIETTASATLEVIFYTLAGAHD